MMLQKILAGKTIHPIIFTIKSFPTLKQRIFKPFFLQSYIKWIHLPLNSMQGINVEISSTLMSLEKF